MDSFTTQVKARSTVLIFNKHNFQKLATNYLESQIPAGKAADEDSISVTYSTKSVDALKGKVVLEVTISADIYTVQDEEVLKNSLTGKTSKEASGVLQNLTEIDKFDTQLRPFWADRLPQDSGSIIIKLKFAD
jgi:hypothetical protein